CPAARACHPAPPGGPRAPTCRSACRCRSRARGTHLPARDPGTPPPRGSDTRAHRPRPHAVHAWWPRPSTPCHRARREPAGRWWSCHHPRETRAPRPAGSLEILQLLAHLLEAPLHRDDDVRDGGVVGLATDRVHFPANLLRKEPELLANR